MEIKIVADSSCEIPESLKKAVEIVNVPLSMSVGDKQFIDDESLDVNEFIDYMNASSTGAKSGCPAPSLFEEGYKTDKAAFAITLSSELSGTYQNAVSAAAGGKAEVIDSQSASAGETLLAYRLTELAKTCSTAKEIAEKAREFVAGMKTYFIIENLGNFIKNGRINPILGKAAGILKLRMIMGSDGHGKIAAYGRSRSMSGAVEKIIELVKHDREGMSGGRVVVSQCRNPEVAKEVARLAKEHGRFDEVEITEMRGLSSMYANQNGIIIAF